MKEITLDQRYFLSYKTQSTLTVPAPIGQKYLPFQLAGIEYVLTTKKALIADPPGVGKTIQAIGVINFLGLRRFLIVAPASLLINWKRELKKWLVDDMPIQVISSGKETPNTTGAVIISYNLILNKNILSFFAYGQKLELLILDEIHYLKNIDAKRTKAVFGSPGLVCNSERVIGLSGTPIVNRPIEIYPTVFNLAPDAINFMTRFKFGLHYCGGYQSQWGWDFSGASNMKELGQNLRKHFMVRRYKNEILPQLPEIRIDYVYLEKDKEVARLSKEFGEIEKQIKSTNAAVIPFEETSSYRRKFGEWKVKQAINFLKDRLESGHKKIIVFAHHVNVIDEIYSALHEFNPVKLTGGMSLLERQRSVDFFQQNEDSHFFIGSITAAGVGITLTASSYVVFVEASYVPGENEQAMDRAHRIGQKSSVLVDFLTVEDSIDELIIKTNLRKEKIIKGVLS